ncbi:MAG: PTS sugar transporter subunit IIA [Verrucomicrobiota bacterium]
MPGLLCEKLKSDYIVVGGSAKRQSEAMLQVSSLLEDHPAVKDFHLLLADLEEREKLESTCLGNELALPHARTDAVTEMVIAVGVFPEGVPGPAGQPVKLFFVIGTPKGMVSDYLVTVGALARMMKEEENRQRLITASSPEQFVNSFRAIECA